MYAPAEKIRLTDGTSLGEVYEPYFDRTPRHFSGHIHTPSKPDASPFAAGSSKGSFTYFAFPIFSCYHQAGSVAMLEIAEKLIGSALGAKRLVTTTLPRAGRVTVRAQAGRKRDVVHLLHATPALRGTTRGAPVQPIQDLVLLNNIQVTVATTGNAKAVRLIPSGEALAFTEHEGAVAFVVPSVTGHQMVEIAY
jgi:hypothetical protein